MSAPVLSGQAQPSSRMLRRSIRCCGGHGQDWAQPQTGPPHIGCGSSHRRLYLQIQQPHRHQRTALCRRHARRRRFHQSVGGSPHGAVRTRERDLRRQRLQGLSGHVRWRRRSGTASVGLSPTFPASDLAVRPDRLLPGPCRLVRVRPDIAVRRRAAVRLRSPRNRGSAHIAGHGREPLLWPERQRRRRARLAGAVGANQARCRSFGGRHNPDDQTAGRFPAPPAVGRRTTLADDPLDGAGNGPVRGLFGTHVRHGAMARLSRRHLAGLERSRTERQRAVHGHESPPYSWACAS